MKAYRDLKPEELAADSSFRRWKSGDNPAASAFWNDWLSRNPDKKELVDQASILLTTISRQYEQPIEERLSISDYEVQQEIQRLYDSLDSDVPEPVRWFRFTPVQYGMAASLVLLLGLFSWFTLRSTTVKRDVTYTELIASVASPLSEVTNTTDKPVVVNLSDGSTILLYPKSRISYAKQFLGTKREVYLSGDAFFNVAKNPSKPFYVYANSLITKVLGTSFRVQINEKLKQVKVVVKTGKVSVYAQNQVPTTRQKEDYKLGGTVLTPNQQVVFSAEDTRLVRSLVDEPVLLKKEDQPQSFVFKRTPIADVFAALEKAYNVKLIFDAETMKDCYLTASLTDEPLFDKLDLICHTINARYDQLDTSIIIDSKGCR